MSEYTAVERPCVCGHVARVHDFDARRAERVADEVHAAHECREMRCPGCDCDPVGYAPHNGKGDCPPKPGDPS